MQKLLLLIIFGYFISYNTIHAQAPEGTFQIILGSEKLVGEVVCPLSMRIQIEELREESKDIVWTSGDWKILILSEEKVSMGIKIPPYSCVEPENIEEFVDDK